jgi:glycosyltransferase involved in cell wall biosynthesis
MTRMRIMFVMDSLSAGGAERVACMLVNHWVQADDQVSMVTIDVRERDFYQLDSRVRRIALGLSRESKNWREFLANNLQRLRRLRGLICTLKPEVIVSFLDATNVLVLLAATGSGVAVIVSERIDPRSHSTGKVVRILRRLLYPRARALVVQTQEVSNWARRVVKPTAVYVIPNPVSFTVHDRKVCETKRSYTILAMGRLEPQKGFDLLLEAFSRCCQGHLEWNLRIIGEGSHRERLRRLAEQLGIADRVRLDRAIKEPATALRDADLFVLSSRYEGFPNALLEAMAAGLPVISFDCPSGPREIIRHGRNGILVPPEDVGALAQAMDRLMGTEHERSELAAGAADVTERFGFDRVMPMWRELLRKAAN